MDSWEKFLAQQETELGIDTVRKWLRTLKVARFDAGNLYLQANDSFQVMWFEEHMRKKVQSSFFNNNKRPIKVHLLLGENSPSIKEKKTKQSNKVKKEIPESPLNPRFTIFFDQLDPLCTFEHFVGSNANPLPQKFLYQLTGYDPTTRSYVAQQPAVTFNPVYLYGISGTGKTHLLMAAAQALFEQNLSVIYVRAETFTEHVVTAIRAGEMSLFRYSYRNADVLIIDDVHLFSKKWATQEELFHTFNALHLAGKQIILSSNCAPSELAFIEPRLISRFEWGIVLPIELLSKEERAKMLKVKASALNYALGLHIEEFFLDTFTSSSKALCRALEALILRTHLNPTSRHLSPTQLTVPFVQHLLSDLILEEQQNALNPTKVVQHVATFFGIRPEDILGKAQSRDCVLPRQLAMYLCRNQLKLPYAKIGHLFSKDHSTVMTSVKLIQKGLDNKDASIHGPMQSVLKQFHRG